MKLIAHRGQSAHYPENTLAAFKAAIDSGFTSIECDVQQTKDNVLVLSHDVDLGRIGNIDKSIHSSDYTELSSVDVGSWFDPKFSSERLAKFADLLNLVPDGVELHVDLKQINPPYGGIEQRVLELTKNRLEHTTFASKNIESLRRFRDLGSGLRLGFQASETSIDQGVAVGRELRIESLRLNKDCINGDWVARAGAESWEIYVYCVSTQAEYNRLKKLGVHGVFTGDPRLGKVGA